MAKLKGAVNGKGCYSSIEALALFNKRNRMDIKEDLATVKKRRKIRVYSKRDYEMY